MNSLLPDGPDRDRGPALVIFDFSERQAAPCPRLDARHALAVHQLLAGEHAAALTLWLSLMREHRSFKDDLARKSLVMAFELIGAADPVAQQARREMTRMLF